MVAKKASGSPTKRATPASKKAAKAPAKASKSRAGAVKAPTTAVKAPTTAAKLPAATKTPVASKTPISTSKLPTTVEILPTATLPKKVPVYHRSYFPVSSADIKLKIPTNNFRILSIDGGGARGMIPAVILKEVERRSGKRISQLFDRICGTSTGSILACGLSAPKTAGSSTPMFRASEIVEIYRTLGEEVFSRGSFNETVIKPMEDLMAHSTSWIVTHPDQTLDTIKAVWKRINSPLHYVHKLAFLLHGFLGELKMKDALTELFVYAYDIGSRTPEILGSSESLIPGARDYSSFRMYQAATASSAAVPFFAPYTVFKTPTAPIEMPMPPPGQSIYPPVGGSGDNYKLVDGGNGGLGNPALFATIEDTSASLNKSKIIVSLGTGHFSQPVPPEASNWGFLQWLGEGGELLTSIFDGEADVTDMALRKLFEKNATYFRWQPSIPQSLAFLDEGSREDMGALEDMAEAFISEHDEEIDTLIAILTRPRILGLP
ncbi:MAG TPA: patatin-like phospholipase family protein [Pyrinomonadaceae bacterium]|nr:patatin-like phospholipase family protein [Pyrinomonadaceae bacterium]